MIETRESIGRYRARLSGFPKVTLGDFPTPLSPLPRLSEELGRRILIKRDDCSGLAFGGNKVRQHEYVLGAALAEGADCVIHGAAAQSNQSRQLAAAGAKLGIEVFLLPKLRPDEPVQGNLLLDELLGATILPVAPETSMVEAKQALFDRLSAEGRRPYVLGMGSTASLELAALAYAEALFEIVESAAAEWPIHWIYTASQGSTQAGLLAGCHALGLPTKVVGVNPMHSDHEAYVAPERILGLARRVCEMLGFDPGLTVDDVRNTTDHVGAGYAIPSDEGRAAIRRLASTEGIVLDPVYSGKAFAGLLTAISEGRIEKDQRVLFLHTGGLPALFAYADDLS